ncbi:MAG: DNA-directed RNA polymerase subunit delta [Clostridia bacterium]|nr:DNA-directed RNA polymerase subunit delta [Clostridia bacterium]MBR3209777.1 DNA-directed RNA polymerase subunit delta [Bacilli bacterium]
MKLNKMTKDELESYSHLELAEMILKEEKKSLDTPSIFKKICDLLELDNEEYKNKIGDFYTSLTTDKKFILLPNGTWDLRDHHSCAVNLEETEDEEDLTETEEEIEDEMNDMAPEEYHDMDDEADVDDTDIDEVDELEEEELTIIDEDELD